MKIEAFKKSYSGRQVLDFPGVELEKGRVYAIIGANGSGKSTFARIVSGIEKPDGGALPTDGMKTGYLPQKSYAFRMRVLNNLLLNGRDETGAKELLEKMGIEHLAEANASRLSGGETARMALCRLMMRTYDAVILDEPCAAMDMESTLLAEKLISEYCREKSCAVVIITHSIQQARRIADEILFFSNGCLLPLSSPEGEAFLEFYGV